MPLKGREAVEHAREHGLTLSKFNDPMEDARQGLSHPDSRSYVEDLRRRGRARQRPTVEEAERVVAEDPSLIYLHVKP